MKKIRLLIPVIFITLMSSTAHAKWDYKKVQSPDECSECHEEEVEVWKDTKHNKTFKKFSSDADAKKIAKKMGVKRIKKADALCTSCHYTVGSKRGKKKVVAGISCESCHSPSKDWIDAHSDYGGKGVKKSQESPAHKKQRHAKIQELGMIRPSNIYGWAKNCYNCHIVPKERLVNHGGHKAGSDFKLFKRSQGKIRHTDKAEGKKADLIKLIGYAVELEMSLRAVGEASGGNKYSDKMTERAKNALSNLKKTNGKINRPEIATVIAMAGAASIKAGNASELNPVADAISVAARIAVEETSDYRYANLDRSKLKVAKASKPAAPKPKPKPAAAPPARPAPVAAAPAPRAAAKPAPAPKPKPAAKPRAPARQPVQVAKATPPAAARSYAKPNFIQSFNLYSPRSSSLCNTDSPWILGEKKVSGTDRLNDDACVSLSVTSGNDGWLYLFSETKNGEIVRLLPNGCNAMTNGNTQIRNGVASNAPLDGNNQEAVLKLRDLPGATGFYAVVVDTSSAKSIVDRQTQNIADVCANSPTPGDIQDTLARLINETEGHLDWRYQRFLRQ